MVRAWIKKDILIGDMVLNQSLDHFATVIQIAGYLQDRGIDAKISHQDGPDLSFEISGERIYLEYEHGEQSAQILQQKKQNTNNGRLVFIGQASNIKYLYKTVGEENTIKRGQQLAEFLDNLIEVKLQEKQEDKGLISSFLNVSEAITANEAV
jgi:hypothetical protein